MQKTNRNTAIAHSLQPLDQHPFTDFMTLFYEPFWALQSDPDLTSISRPTGRKKPCRFR